MPEGVYAIEAFNSNSRFHLSLKLDYPNAVDRQQAALEGRDQLGGDIFLHGKDVSVGCLAMGDAAIEELFVLVARTGIERATARRAVVRFSAACGGARQQPSRVGGSAVWAAPLGVGELTGLYHDLRCGKLDIGML